jgi:molecular chaperone DnaK (HSP70)
MAFNSLGRDMSHEPYIAIDLGTSHSRIAVVESGAPVVINNSEGMRSTPSVFAYTLSSDRLVGHLAKRQAVINPKGTIQSIKRQMGSNYRVQIRGDAYSPELISSIMLRKMKDDAEAYIGETISKAVISCPSCFTQAQRQATLDAAQIAGLDVVELINETTAAALSLNKPLDEGTLMVVSVGGGVCDTTIVRALKEQLTVVATNGCVALGGDDFTQKLIDWMISEALPNQGIDIAGDAMALERIKERAERSKYELSTCMKSELDIPFLAASPTGPKHFEASMEKTHFEKLVAPLVQDILGLVQQTLADAQLRPSEIDQFFLIGGSSRIPMLQHAIARVFDNRAAGYMKPEEAVVEGAAIRAAMLHGKRKEVVIEEAERPRTESSSPLHGLTREEVIRLRENEDKINQREVERRQRAAVVVKGELSRFEAEKCLAKYSNAIDVHLAAKIRELVDCLDKALRMKQGSEVQTVSESLDKLVLDVYQRFSGDEDPPQAAYVPRKPYPITGGGEIVLPLPDPPEEPE